MLGVLLRSVSMLLLMAMLNHTALAANIDCPVGLVSGLTLDDEFGPGTKELTRCLEKKPIKVLFQINQFCANTACTRPYALSNVTNAIDDYEITHGFKKTDYKIALVVHGEGINMVLNNTNLAPGTPDRNPFVKNIEKLLANGVKIYLCQNTARSRGIKTADLIPGVGYVTAGVSAIADFQGLDYSYVQP